MGSANADIEAMALEALTTFGRAVSYQRRVAGALSGMSRQYSTNDTSLTAMREEVRQSYGASAAVSEFNYTFRKTDLSYDPDTNDIIQDTEGVNSLFLSVVSVESAANGLLWKVRAKQKASGT